MAVGNLDIAADQDLAVLDVHDLALVNQLVWLVAIATFASLPSMVRPLAEHERSGPPTVPAHSLRTSLRLNNDLPVSTFVELAVAAEEPASTSSGCPTTCSCALRRSCWRRRPGRRSGSCSAPGSSTLTRPIPVELAMHAATLQELSVVVPCSASPRERRSSSNGLV